jgi:hypothetical protein
MTLISIDHDNNSYMEIDEYDQTVEYAQELSEVEIYG